MNVALVGHVDAGKTTLARALTDVASTAAFNHAEGRENTIDLGYSSVVIGDSRVCLIDCPGHAGLIRAVVAASSVIDAALVVVSAVRGVEPQTAEHLLLASLCCPSSIVVVLSKCDVATPEQIASAEKAVKKAAKTLNILPEPSILKVCLVPPLADVIDEIKGAVAHALKQRWRESESNSDPRPLIAVDHCFTVKGKGTVLTSSLLRGVLKQGAEVELPQLKEKRKIKELQSWKESVQEVRRGERVALLVAALPSTVPRCIIGAPGLLTSLTHVRVSVNVISFFRFPIKDGAKVHISCGYETEMATVRFGRREEGESAYELLPWLSAPCTAFISLARPLFSPLGSFYVASRLELQGKGCRFAFHGTLEEAVVAPPRFYSRQKREGEVERVQDNRSVIVKGLFKKETKTALFTGMKVRLSTGEIGMIEGSFGSSGKTRVTFPVALNPGTLDRITSKDPVKIRLHIKKYLDDRSLVAYLPEKGDEKEDGEEEGD